MIEFLTVEDIEKVCFEYAKTKLALDEPIPPFTTRFPGKLESALAAPQRPPNTGSFERQAAVLFYEMIKLHPFLNGNKRVATVTLMTLLMINSHWLRLGWQNLYEVAVQVAESNPKARDKILSMLEDWIKKNILTETIK